MYGQSIARFCCALFLFGPALVFGPASFLTGSLLFAQQATSLDRLLAEEGAFLDATENQRLLAAAATQAEVERQLAAARRRLDSHPAAAVATLKGILGDVEAAPELSADVRLQLRDRLVTAIRQAQRRQLEKQQRDQIAAARRAAGRQRQRALEASARREEKVQQIIARFNALMDEGRYRDAEAASYEARDLAQSDPAIVAAVHQSRMTGYVRDMAAVREARHKGIVDALHRVERAHVPTADEPPIVYPDAQVWEELTRRRRKYAAMSLEKRGSAEERIFEALDQPTTLEFIETPLRDVVDYLKDLHGIEIQINYRALEEIGIDADTMITRNLKGISLRSALRLVLRDLNLTYTVRDEVLQITTPEEVESDLTAKVYPVADLVLPIHSGIGANPFQMGGGLGGPGGFGQGRGNQGGFGNQMNGGNFNPLGNDFGIRGFGNPPGGGPLF